MIIRLTTLALLATLLVSCGPSPTPPPPGEPNGSSSSKGPSGPPIEDRDPAPGPDASDTKPPGPKPKGPITLPAGASNAQALAVFARQVKAHYAKGPLRPIGGRGRQIAYRVQILGKPVIIIMDEPMPDAGDAYRHGAFVDGTWVGSSGMRTAIFAAHGYAEAKPERKVEIATAWAKGTLSSNKAPEVSSTPEGGVRLRIHIQANFGVGGFPLTNEWWTLTFDAAGKQISREVEPIKRKR